MTATDQYTIDGHVFQVLVNDEEQYSIWPAGKQIPDGWKPVDFTGSKSECSVFIDRTWTDMRPRSLREKMKNTVARS
jgi:MbtH protein